MVSFKAKIETQRFEKDYKKSHATVSQLFVGNVVGAVVAAAVAKKNPVVTGASGCRGYSVPVHGTRKYISGSAPPMSVLKFTKVPWPGDRCDADGTWLRRIGFDSGCTII